MFDNIEDSTDNFTRFLIISKDIKNQRSENDKTSLLRIAPTLAEPSSSTAIKLAAAIESGNNGLVHGGLTGEQIEFMPVRVVVLRCKTCS